MTMPVKDAVPHRMPTNTARTEPVGQLTEFLEPAIPAAFKLYVDTGYVDLGYVEGE